MIRFPSPAVLLCVPALAAPGAFADQTFSYDALGRVISARSGDGRQILYRYDAAGNRTEHEVSPATVNRPPSAAADAIVLTENQNAVSLNPRLNDSDPDGDPLTLFAVSSGAFGAGALSGGGASVTYTSAHKRNAIDRLVYTIDDGEGMHASGEIAITLANLAPNAIDDAISTPKNTPKIFDPRVNDNDPGGDALTVTATSTPAHGALAIGAGGLSLAYTPATNYTGPDSFTYTITDADGAEAAATVSVTVTP